MHFAEIETERLRLRPIAADDWPAILSYMSDPHVTAYLPPGAFDEPAARAFALKQSANERTAVAVIEKASGQLIGHMPYHAWAEPQTYEIGWALHPAHQGKGYATEAARALLARAFDTLKAHREVCRARMLIQPLSHVAQSPQRRDSRVSNPKWGA